MNKALCVAAAVALALSGTAFAKGSSKHRAQSQAATDAQISMSDCNTLSVESARNDCMRWAQAQGGASAGTSVGATSSASGGTAEGGGKMQSIKRKAGKMRDSAMSQLKSGTSADPSNVSETAPAQR